MDPRTLNYIADACGGELLRGIGSGLARHICTDSRRVRPGDIFLAIAGPAMDGHTFLAEASAKGASAVIIAKSRDSAAAGSAAVIAVEDTRHAYGRLAARYRQDFALPVVAVGGSNGKTTTKELIAAVLREKFKTLASLASFNNDIGVPATLLQLESSHTAAVFEVGTNHPGELAPLVAMIRPRLGVVTSLGREHLEFFGDLDGVAREEGALAELLPPDGTLFVHGDNPGMDAITARAKCRVVRAGFDARNDWRAENVRLEEGGTVFAVKSAQAGFNGDWRFGLHGRHQVINALFAIAIGAELGVTAAQARHALEHCAPLNMRLETWKAGDITVLDDSYNANADSMLAALRTLREMPCAGRRVAVLGDMAELGAHSAAAHAEVGRGAAELGVRVLFTTGKWAAVMAEAAKSAGLKNVFVFENVPDAAQAVRAEVKPGDRVLLKASRATRLERVSAVLKADRD